MKKNLLLAVIVATSSFDVAAQDVAAVIEAAAAAMGTTSLQSIQYSGTGTNNTVGQAFTPGGPWPRFTVTKYVMSVNYAVPVMRQQIDRIDNENPPRGGGAGPFNAVTGQGGLRPIPGDIIQDQTSDGRTEAGAINIWLTPHGFLKGAAANAATAKTSTARGKKMVSFTAFGKYSVIGTIDGQNLVERVETRIDNGFLGDLLIEGIYSEYKDFGGVKFPTRIVQRQGGHPVLDITVADVQVNRPGVIEVRGAAPGAGRAGPSGPAGAGPSVTTDRRGGPSGPDGRGGPSGPPAIQTERIADGLWFLNSGAPQSLLVEFSDHVVIIEAPTNDARTLATIAEAKRMFPAKPIRYLVNTHHHADHAGGLRAYVAEGIPIITHEVQKRYYEQEVFRSPHTLNPDRLARNPRLPIVEGVSDKRVLTDGRMTLELHLVRGNLHSEGLLMAYVPREKLLIQADAFAPRPGAPPLPAPSPYTVNLVDNVRRLKLDVTRVVHVHGGNDAFETVVKASLRSPGP